MKYGPLPLENPRLVKFLNYKQVSFEKIKIFITSLKQLLMLCLIRKLVVNNNLLLCIPIESDED